MFAFFFSQWRFLYIKRKQEKLERKQKMVRCMKSLDSYWKRRMKVLYLCWRDQLIIKNEAIRTLYRFVSDRRIMKTQQAFQKWKNFKLDFEFNLRMHGLTVKICLKRLKTQLFYAWRTWARQQKTYKMSLKLRAFKNLRMNVTRRKQLAFMTLGMLGVENRTDDLIR